MAQDAEKLDQPDTSDREYSLMLEIERLESLREQMDEAGFSTLDEIEATLALTNQDAPKSGTGELATQRALLEEIRDELLELGLSTYAEVNDQISTFHRQLDELEGFDTDADS